MYSIMPMGVPGRVEGGVEMEEAESESGEAGGKVVERTAMVVRFRIRRARIAESWTLGGGLLILWEEWAAVRERRMRGRNGGNGIVIYDGNDQE